MVTQSVYKFDFPLHLRSKILLAWPEFFESNDISVQGIRSVVKTFCLLPYHTRFAFFRTAIAAWTTTHRMHEKQLLSCLWGCSDKDCIHHYIQCPVLWRVVHEATGIQPSVFCSHRLGVMAPTAAECALPALASQIYHYCKNVLSAHPEGGLLQPNSNVMFERASNAAFVFAERLL